MKKIIFFGLIWLTILSACEKNEPEPLAGKRPDERLNEVLTDYKTQLAGAVYGWKAILYPEGGAGYSFLFQFTADDRVRMYSDINSSTAEEALESTYRLTALQRPALLFDTYSYLHILADPDASKSGGDWGEGKYSDFEFSFTSVSPDTISLTGNYNGSRLILIRATESDAENYIDRIAETAEAFESIDNFTTYFKRFTAGNQVFDVSVQTEVRSITFSYYEGDVRGTYTSSYYYTEDGLVLLEPFTVGNITIRSLTNIRYDALGNRINLMINGETAASIREAAAPVKADRQAAQRFYSAPNDYWISVYGFTIDGVEDALGVRTIPDFSFLVYWPRFGAAENGEYDLMGFVANNSIQYGPAAVPTLTNDGRIVYTFLGMLGEENIPEEYAPIVTATMEQWTEPEGYYVVQTGPGAYDLVSAKDAKSWISFF